MKPVIHVKTCDAMPYLTQVTTLMNERGMKPVFHVEILFAMPYPTQVTTLMSEKARSCVFFVCFFASSRPPRPRS